LIKKKNVLAILLDLSKAFDTVDHSISIAKLKKYSFSTNSLALIKNYLSNRYSITKFKDCFSDKNLNEEGVPQGSILDPLFFIIFLMISVYLLVKGEMMLYADDTTVSFASAEIFTLFQVVTEDLKLSIIDYYLIYLKQMLSSFLNGAHSTKQTVLPRLIFDDILIPIVYRVKRCYSKSSL
jgi:hypothetical protein